MIVQILSTAEATPQTSTTLSVERLFNRAEFAEKKPQLIVWSQDGTSFYTKVPVLEEKNAHDIKSGTTCDIVRVNIVSGEKTIIVAAQELVPPHGSEPLVIEDLRLSADESHVLIYTNSQRVWRKNTRGDYWVLPLGEKNSTNKNNGAISTKNGTLKKIGGDAPPASLQFAKFSPDGSRVAYVQHNNIYLQELSDMGIQALTTDGSATVINGTADWVNEEELGIRDGFLWSPDGQAIAFWQFDTSKVPTFSLIDNTSELYPRVTTFAYPKVGQTNSATRIGIVQVPSGTINWLPVPGDPREHYIPVIGWSPDSTHLMLHQLNRLQNTNVVMLAQAQSGNIRVVLTETDDAWVENENLVWWLNDGKEFVWMSDRDGWRHAYVASCKDGTCKLLTPGNFDLITVEAIDEKNGWIYYTAAPDQPTQQHLFRVHINTGVTEQCSPATQPGWHSYEYSPDGQWATHTYSRFTTPPFTEIVRLSDHSHQQMLSDNLTLRKKIAAINDVSADFFRVDIGDGHIFDGWSLMPKNRDPNKKYPLFFYVYGEPAGQTVCDKWVGPNGLWHWMLAQQGYIVASIDTRGTKVPRGRAWRKSIYRNIGIIAPQDFSDAVHKLLEQWAFADPQRVGVWGWSGGGSNTLHAIFRFPDLFQTAIAVAPNANQLLYDSIYQERYMGSPIDNADGYRRGSPIFYADKLQGNLLLIHGTGDDNGHYQGTETLINKLIEHDKDFSVMPYPARTHSIKEGNNTVPHLYKLMTNYLIEHMPPNKISNSK